jgi:hypothetical protein
MRLQTVGSSVPAGPWLTYFGKLINHCKGQEYLDENRKCELTRLT